MIYGDGFSLAIELTARIPLRSKTRLTGIAMQCQLTWFGSYRRFVSTCAVAFLVAGIGFVPAPVLLAAEPMATKPPQDRRMTPKGTVNALVSSREKLHSGEARARWKWTTPKFKESADWRLHFDYDKGLSRVDRHIINDGHRSIRVDTPDESIIYVPVSGVISRHPPGAPALAHGYVFDVRTTGLAALISIKGNAATWPAFLAMLERDGRPTLRTEADGTLCVTWSKSRAVKTPNGNLLERFGHSFWVDSKRDFAPVRATFFQGASPDPSVDGTKISAIVETEWTETQGTLVPLRCAWQSPLSEQSAELTFEWVSVNGPVDEKLFTPKGLGAPKGTLIVNTRFGEDVIESTIGEESPMRIRPQSKNNSRRTAGSE